MYISARLRPCKFMWLARDFLRADYNAGSMWALALWDEDTNESWQAPQACGGQKALGREP